MKEAEGTIPPLFVCRHFFFISGTLNSSGGMPAWTSTCDSHSGNCGGRFLKSAPDPISGGLIRTTYFPGVNDFSGGTVNSPSFTATVAPAPVVPEPDCGSNVINPSAIGLSP